MIPTGELGTIVAIAGAASLAVTICGVGVLRAVRLRSLLTGVLVVAVAAVTAVLAGAVATASAMFLSPHDLRVLLIVAGVAGAVGVGTAAILARSVVAGLQAVGAAAAGMTDGSYVRPTRSLNAELRALDGQLAETSRRLEEGRLRERDLERSRRDLVAWVSHDLRTPLAGIRAMSEALEDRVVADEETVERYHAGIRREADRLSVMVDDLFELSRINASALHLKLREVALDDVLSDAIATAQPVAAAGGVRVVAVAGEATSFVHGSVPELGRILRNLLANAVRHTPAGGTVVVELAYGADNVAVEVRDGCGGIPEQDLPRLFDVAFRGTSARTPGEDGGAGLGLAIARGLVHAHGGTVSIANVDGGCCARVLLPTVGAEAPPTETAKLERTVGR